jgi:hypothetical protein
MERSQNTLKDAKKDWLMRLIATTKETTTKKVFSAVINSRIHAVSTSLVIGTRLDGIESKCILIFLQTLKYQA